IFALRAFLIVAFGDIPAVSALMGMKGHNARSPCRMCEITGVRIPSKPRVTTHYVPLDRSTHPHVLANDDAIKVFNATNLPLRTHTGLLAQANEVANAATATQADALATQYGIKHVPLLSTLHSMSLPTSFPYDFMHLIWENLVKNLVLLWTGEFKGLDDGGGSYTISKAIWEAIGQSTAATGDHIPSAYGVRVPDISKDRTLMSAEMWSFWTLFLGPILLRPFLNAQYHLHFVQLVVLLNQCLAFSMSIADVEDLRKGMAKWVIEFERFVPTLSNSETICHDHIQALLSA
ncbi:hypothetical protein CYLTODRAFT_363809, partial [Cylindrobasidium torrendii FP15055 ss-10]